VSSFAGRFVALCWLAFFFVWIVAAFWTKRTAERSGWRSIWWVWFAIAVFVFLRRRAVPFAGGRALWHDMRSLSIAAAAITVVGLCIAVWARMMLGGNWSSSVVLKEEHELIDHGPYRFVRHPIYTGVLLMVLGTVILSGTLAGLTVLGVSIAGFSIKARREERLLTKHFPAAYPRYRAQVKAMLVPFVI
jgi:protein-S-isoprenylcysteine O-methyltransferase Ste14